MWGFPAAWHWQERRAGPALARPGWLAGVGAVLAVAGLAVAVGALRGYDLGEFAGGTCGARHYRPRRCARAA